MIHSFRVINFVAVCDGNDVELGVQQVSDLLMHTTLENNLHANAIEHGPWTVEEQPYRPKNAGWRSKEKNYVNWRSLVIVLKLANKHMYCYWILYSVLKKSSNHISFFLYRVGYYTIQTSNKTNQTTSIKVKPFLIQWPNYREKMNSTCLTNWLTEKQCNIVVIKLLCIQGHGL